MIAVVALLGLEAEENSLLSTLNKPAPASPSVASTRLSSRFTSRPGSVAASCSIAAMRFFKRWPVVLLIEPERIAAWMAANGSLSPTGALLAVATAAASLAVIVFEAAAAESVTITSPPAPADGAIVTVELALIVNVSSQNLLGC